MSKQLYKTNVNFENLSQIQDYLFALQKKSLKYNRKYICNINGMPILVRPIVPSKNNLPNFEQDMQNYHYNIFRTFMLGKLAGHCYYDELKDYDLTKAFLLTDKSYDNQEFINIVNSIENSNNERFVEFCPMPYLKNQNEETFWAQNSAIKNKLCYYYNFGGVDLVALPFNNYKYNINLAKENYIEAQQLNRYLTSFEEAEDYSL